jgi:hypothetical protein
MRSPDWAALGPLRLEQRGTGGDEKRRDKQLGSSTFLKEGHAAKHRSKWCPTASNGPLWAPQYPFDN